MKSTVEIIWEKGLSEPFTDNKYSRVHLWKFDGGLGIKSSSSPQVVPLPMSDENAVDPEEAFVAAVASCHMLWFLSLAAEKKLVVESYEDKATGILTRNDEGKQAIKTIILQPKVILSINTVVSPEQLNQLHELAHEKCYIANSIKTKVEIIP